MLVKDMIAPHSYPTTDVRLWVLFAHLALEIAAILSNSWLLPTQIQSGIHNLFEKNIDKPI
jgi:hypothetical protein